MINLRANGMTTKWFVWSCDHLPATSGYDYFKKEAVRRKGVYYVENGTTLCHIFWAILWVPLVLVAVSGFFLWVVVAFHVELYHEYSLRIGIAAAFMPEIFVLGLVSVFAIIVFSIIGADKVGFWKLLWAYLSGLKNRVCPLVSFRDQPKSP